MAVQAPQDLLLHGLGDVYTAEHIFLSALNDMVQNCQDPRCKQALQRHIQETQHQIRNLEQCYQSYGQPARQTGCPGAEGIVQEYRTGIRDVQSPPLRDLFVLESADRAEHYEIAVYTNLVQSCRTLGNQQCCQLLEENLRQEQRFAQECEQLHQQLGQQVAAGGRMP